MMTPERLAEIRGLLVAGWPYHREPRETMADLLAEVDRLRAKLAATEAAYGKVYTAQDRFEEGES